MTNENKLYKASYITLAVITALILILSIPKITVNLNEQIGSMIAYFILVLIPLVSIGVVATIKTNKKEISKKDRAISLAVIWSCLVIIFAFILISVNHKSQDYEWFLNGWTNYYRDHSIKDSLYAIIEITNYAPAYNYILMIISRIPMYNLHLIKYVSFLFSILLAYMMCKIIAKIRKTEFNYVLFVAFLLLPYLSIEYAAWAQCDAIYASLAITAFYFALCKKSKLSFLFLGLSFIFKLQFLFIVPIMFILLIIKDEEGNHYLKWKDIWIPFAVYLINCIPVFAGRSLWEMLIVYVNQSVNDPRICGECANICLIYYKFLGIMPDTLAHNILLWVHVAITFAILIFYLVLVFKNNKKKTFTFYDIVFWGFVFSFTMVFLMPKMLDRFYFITACLSTIFMFAFRDKHACIIGILTNLFFSISMLSAVYLWPNWTAISMLIVAFVDFGYILYVIFSKYGKVLKKDKPNVDTTPKTITPNQ